MIPDILTIVLAIVLALAIAFCVFSIRIYQAQVHKKADLITEKAKLDAYAEELKKEKQLIAEQAEAKKREIIIEAKDEAHKLRQDVEYEIREKRAEVQRIERRLQQKEETLARRLETSEQKELEIQRIQQQITAKRKEAEELLQKQYEELQRIANMTEEEARQIFLKRVEDESRHEASKIILQIEEETKRQADARAREIVVDTIQRCAIDFVNETSVSVVELPNDDMKGRIIGREGRNIRTFEQILGVDLIIDDTPEAVVLSCFDPIRREIARIALTNLIVDGRIHPARIEEAAAKAKSEVDRQIIEAGERAVLRAGIAGLHPELIKQMGRLKFRTSYSQNVLSHSVEVSLLAAHMATELGADVETARRAAFLHDIGKGLDIEIEGTHAVLGMELCKKYGENEKIINAIGAHHSEVPASTVEAILVIAADGLSAGRPGARRETLESYIKRLEKLEGIAESFKGVEKCYAVQAGREIRIIVKPAEIDDYGSYELARDIARRIEEEVEYPGQIKVTVIRETRAQEFAK